MTLSNAETSFELDELGEFLSSEGHTIVLGGPGSGKTTAALIKANQEIAKPEWKRFQQALFLSFARSTVGRVAEAAGGIIEKQVRDRVELTTYHSFAWKLIRSHGYLLQSEPSIRLLPPHDASARIAEATRDSKDEEAKRQRDVESRRLLSEEGLLVFDLFAELAADLLEKSNRICRIVSSRYPLIYLDEFQDTNKDEYRLIKCLARNSKIIALADPEQRIYEFRGADPKRIGEFITECSPDTFDFAQRNHRSNGTDILKFANDLLTETTPDNEYKDVRIKFFPTRRGAEQHLWMKGELIGSINRARAERDDWSVGVLVPTKKMMLIVSEFLMGRQKIDAKRTLPILQHEVGVDAEGPALAGVAIGRLMECSTDTVDNGARILLEDLCGHIVGRKSGKPASKAELTLIDGLQAYLTDGKLVGSKRKRIVGDCTRIAADVVAINFTGDPYADWISVRNVIAASESDEMKTLASDAQYLKFLRKGTQLRLKLSSLWKDNLSYLGATEAVQNAFIQEHFVAKSQEPRGVHVMTIHKSKGKEFDEVLIYEGIYADRIVRRPDEEDVVAQARLSLRVAVSRARKRVTILTPRDKCCELL